MLKIRMQRTGRTNDPSFRVVVIEHTQSTKAGDFVEKLGTYNPKTKEQNLNADRIKYWMSVGAQPSDTMHNMLIAAGILEGKKRNVLPKKSPPKKEEVAEEGVPAGEASPAPEAAPTPEEEAVPTPPVEDAAKEEAPVAPAAPTPEGDGVPTPSAEDVGKAETDKK